MKTLMILMGALLLSMPVVVGCEKDEMKVERREKIQVQTDPTPIVVPDAPQK